MTAEPTSITDPITFVSEDGHTLSYIVVPVSEITHEELIRQRDAVVACLYDIKAKYRAKQAELAAQQTAEDS